MTDIVLSPTAMPTLEEPVQTAQPYIQFGELQPTVQFTDDGMIIDPEGLRIGEPLVLHLEGQPLLVLKRDAETVDFYCFPDAP